MNISQKIAEMRQQPEHVRMRYVWISVSISMLIIVAIWIFSIGLMFKKDKTKTDQVTDPATDIAKQLQDIKQQAPSLQDYANQPLNVSGNEGVNSAVNNADSSNFQYPASTSDSETPQASGYSDLPKATPVQ